MAEKKYYVTQEGYDAMLAELDELKNVRRQEVSQRIKEAIALGDLSENSEYDDAKNEQAFLEGRIAELEGRVKNAEIIVAGAAGGRITVGSTVTLRNHATGKEVMYTVTGSSEADPFAKPARISNESPIGAALLDKMEGDQVEADTPAGKRTFTVLKVEA